MPDDSAARMLANASSSVVHALTRDLAAGVSADGDGAPRLFFPNGIERIYLKIAVGSGITAELEIAGEKGIKKLGSALARTLEAAQSPSIQRGRSTADLAQALLATARISLASTHATTPPDGATAIDNIRDSAAGRNAKRSEPTPPGSGNPPGGEVALSADMLGGILEMSRTYTFAVSEIAGGRHSSPLSRHYVGVAFDVNVINGQLVSAAHPDFRAFLDACGELGATELVGPGDPGHDTHVHAAWPRPQFMAPDVDVPDGGSEE